MNSGAEAVETAVKTARKWGYQVKKVATDRAEIIVCTDNFHGRTTTIVGFSSEPQYKEDFGPFTPGFKLIPYGDLKALEQAITPNTVGFLVEPIQGEAGILIPPAGYLKSALELCRKNRVLLIADEIQTGFGRTGTMFACEHYGLFPDLMVTAKSLAGGLPLAAVTGRADILNAPQVGGLGGTYGGNPLACAAALGVLDAMKDENIVAHGARVGNLLRERFLRWAAADRGIGDVRGLGAMMALELVKDPGSKVPDKERTGRVLGEALKRGLILLSAGTYGNVVRVLVPLTIDDAVLEEGLAVMELALGSG